MQPKITLVLRIMRVKMITYIVILWCVQHFSVSRTYCVQHIIVSSKILCPHLPKRSFVHISHFNVLQSYYVLAKHLRCSSCHFLFLDVCSCFVYKLVQDQIQKLLFYSENNFKIIIPRSFRCGHQLKIIEIEKILLYSTQ